MTKVWILACLLALSWGIAAQEELSWMERKPGDLIWGQCTNITRTIVNYNVQIQNACIQLTEVTDCGVSVHFAIGAQTIFDQRLDTSIASRVCGNYSFSQAGYTIDCNICVVLRNDKNNATMQCVSVEPTCKIVELGFVVPLDPYQAGCFGNDKLSNIERCRAGECPAPGGLICSNHGICSAGTCNCDAGFFGGDCSLKNQLFEQCRSVNQLAGDVCTRLIFDSCNLKVQMVLIAGPLEVPLYEKSYPVNTLKVVFQNDICTNNGGCSICLKWNNLILTSTQAHGCGTLALTCGGNSLGSYSLGCFDDNQVIPACFGTCLNSCSGHGTCNLGNCLCDPNFSSPDCSVQSLPCPNGCGQGKCNNGVCSCNDGWIGSTCSQAASNNQNSNFNAALVVIPLILVVGIAALGVGIWYIKKKKETLPKFNEFDLLEQESEEALVVN